MKSTDLKLRRTTPTAWALVDAGTGAAVGSIKYRHAADGNHYRAWMYVNGVQRQAGGPVPQLAMAVRAVGDAVLTYKRQS